MKDITIHSVRLTNDHNQACASISTTEINDGNPFGYFLDLVHDVDSEVHRYIRSKIDSGEIELLPPLMPQADYESDTIKRSLKGLLHETDQFMTIDTELTDDEIKILKEYRHSLRILMKDEGKQLTKEDLPKLPEFIKKDAYDIYYVGANSLEK